MTEELTPQQQKALKLAEATKEQETEKMLKFSKKSAFERTSSNQASKNQEKRSNSNQRQSQAARLADKKMASKITRQNQRDSANPRQHESKEEEKKGEIRNHSSSKGKQKPQSDGRSVSNEKTRSQNVASDRQKKRKAAMERKRDLFSPKKPIGPRKQNPLDLKQSKLPIKEIINIESGATSVDLVSPPHEQTQIVNKPQKVEIMQQEKSMTNVTNQAPKVTLTKNGDTDQTERPNDGGTNSQSTLPQPVQQKTGINLGEGFQQTKQNVTPQNSSTLQEPSQKSPGQIGEKEGSGEKESTSQTNVSQNAAMNQGNENGVDKNTGTTQEVQVPSSNQTDTLAQTKDPQHTNSPIVSHEEQQESQERQKTTARAEDKDSKGDPTSLEKVVENSSHENNDDWTEDQQKQIDAIRRAEAADTSIQEQISSEDSQSHSQQDVHMQEIQEKTPDKPKSDAAWSEEDIDKVMNQIYDNESDLLELEPRKGSAQSDDSFDEEEGKKQMMENLEKTEKKAPNPNNPFKNANRQQNSTTSLFDLAQTLPSNVADAQKANTTNQNVGEELAQDQFLQANNNADTTDQKKQSQNNEAEEVSDQINDLTSIHPQKILSNEIAQVQNTFTANQFQSPTSSPVVVNNQLKSTGQSMEPISKKQKIAQQVAEEHRTLVAEHQFMAQQQNESELQKKGNDESKEKEKRESVLPDEDTSNRLRSAIRQDGNTAQNEGNGNELPIQNVTTQQEAERQSVTIPSNFGQLGTKPLTPSLQSNQARSAFFDPDQSQIMSTANLSERISVANVDDSFINIDFTNEAPLNRIVDYINIYRDRQTNYQKVIVKYRNQQIAQQLADCLEQATEAVISCQGESDFRPTKFQLNSYQELAEEIFAPNIPTEGKSVYEKYGPDNNFHQLLNNLIHKFLINYDHTKITAETMIQCQKFVLTNRSLKSYQAQNLHQANKWTFERYLLRSLVPIGKRVRQAPSKQCCNKNICRLQKELSRRPQSKKKTLCQPLLGIGIGATQKKILDYNQAQWKKKSLQRSWCFEKQVGAYAHNREQAQQLNFMPLLKNIKSWLLTQAPGTQSQVRLAANGVSLNTIESMTQQNCHYHPLGESVKSEITSFLKYFEGLFYATYNFFEDLPVNTAFEPKMKQWQIKFLGDQAIERLIVVGQCVKSPGETDEKHPFAIVNLTEAHANLVLTYEDIRATDTSESSNLPYCSDYQRCYIKAVPLLLEIMLNGLQVLKSLKIVSERCLIQSIVFINDDKKSLVVPNKKGVSWLRTMSRKDIQGDFFAPTFAVVETLTMSNFAFTLDVPLYTLVCFSPYKYQPLTTQLVIRQTSLQLRDFGYCVADIEHQLAQYAFLKSVFCEMYIHDRTKELEIQEKRRRLYNSSAMWSFSFIDQFQELIQVYQSLEVKQTFHPEHAQSLLERFDSATSFIDSSLASEINVSVAQLAQQFKAQVFMMTTIAYQTLYLQLAILQDANTVAFAQQSNNMRAQQALLLYQLCSKLRKFNFPESQSECQFYSKDESASLKKLLNYQEEIVPVEMKTTKKRTKQESQAFSHDTTVSQVQKGFKLSRPCMPGTPITELPNFNQFEEAKQNGGAKNQSKKFQSQCTWKGQNFGQECEAMATICKMFTCLITEYGARFLGFKGQVFTKEKNFFGNDIPTIDGFNYLRAVPLSIPSASYQDIDSMKFCRYSLSLVLRLVVQDVINQPQLKLLNSPLFDDRGKDHRTENPLVMTDCTQENVSSNNFNLAKWDHTDEFSGLYQGWIISIMSSMEHYDLQNCEGYKHVPRLIAFKHLLLFMEAQAFKERDHQGTSQRRATWFEDYHKYLRILPSSDQSFCLPTETDTGRVLYLSYGYGFYVRQIEYMMHSYLILRNLTLPKEQTMINLLCWLLCDIHKANIRAHCESFLYFKALSKVIVASEGFVYNGITNHDSYRLSVAEVKYHFANATLPLAYLQEVPILSQQSDAHQFLVQFVFWKSFIIKSHNFENKNPTCQPVYHFDDYQTQLNLEISKYFDLKELKDPVRNDQEQHLCTKFALEVQIAHHQQENAIDQDVLESLQNQSNHRTLLISMAYKKDGQVHILGKTAQRNTSNKFEPIATLLQSLHSTDTKRNHEFFYCINFFTTRTLTTRDTNYPSIKALSDMGLYYSSLEIEDYQLPALNQITNRYEESRNLEICQQKFASIHRPLPALQTLIQHLVKNCKIATTSTQMATEDFIRKHPPLKDLILHNNCLQKNLSYAIKQYLSNKSSPKNPYDN